MSVSWSQKTGDQIIYAARSMVGDIVSNNFRVSNAMASTLYRHAVLRVLMDLNWKTDIANNVAIAQGAYTAAHPAATTSETLAWSEASWNTSGRPLERRSPEELRRMYAYDTSAGGQVQQGWPRFWGFERAASGAITILVYPAADQAGTLTYYSNEVARSLYDTSVTNPLDWSTTQLVETRLAADMAQRISPSELAAMGVGPQVGEVCERDYREKLALEKARIGQVRRQRRVTIRGC